MSVCIAEMGLHPRNPIGKSAYCPFHARMDKTHNIFASRDVVVGMNLNLHALSSRFVHYSGTLIMRPYVSDEEMSTVHCLPSSDGLSRPCIREKASQSNGLEVSACNGIVSMWPGSRKPTMLPTMASGRSTNRLTVSYARCCAIALSSGAGEAPRSVC